METILNEHEVATELLDENGNVVIRNDVFLTDIKSNTATMSIYGYDFPVIFSKIVRHGTDLLTSKYYFVDIKPEQNSLLDATLLSFFYFSQS